MSTIAPTQRIVIYAKDVMTVTGKEKRAAYRLLKRIRTKYNLPAEAFITIDHFCKYTGIREERMLEFLR